MPFDTEQHPGVCERPSAASRGFVLNHSMLRMKDPAVSLDFYTRIFGMPDLDAAVRWLDENAVPYVKRPEQGKMRDVAFVKDPDGYWIEIVEPKRLKNLGRG